MNKPASELVALADCPFCGSGNISDRHVRDGRQMFCINCGASVAPTFHGPRGDTLDRAKEAWNTRTAANQSGSERAGVDALREALITARECIWSGGSTISTLKIIDTALATPPAQPAPAATHGKPDGAVREAVRFVLHNDERERDYPIYETDDDRGLDECEYINFATDVIAALRSPKIAAAETSPGDVLAMKEAWRKFSGLMLVDGDPPSIVYPAEVDQNEWASAYDGLCAAIDRLDVKAEAKSQEPEACK